jgi:hypothetical protein
VFKRAETMYAYHWSLHANDRIRVGPWEGPDCATRRMVFLVPYQAPGWFKRAVGALALASPDALVCPWCRAPSNAAVTLSALDGQAHSSACLSCLAAGAQRPHARPSLRANKSAVESRSQMCAQ